jgi:biofilm PGA synthesis protein PgaA
MHTTRQTWHAATVAGWALMSGWVCPGAQAADRPIEETYAEHTRAVEAARAGQHDEGLAILARLLDEFPDDYPLNRDFILISSWNDDCEAVLARVEYVRSQPQFEPYLVRAVADCAVKRARADDPDAALAILESLAARQPDDYALARDIIVIRTWKRECSAAIERYDNLTQRPPPEPYFAIAVADCLLLAERPKEAAVLIDDALAQAPDDEGLLYARRKALGELPLATRDNPYRELVFNLASDDSDQGVREWYAGIEASMPVATDTRAYARYLATLSSDAELRAGDMDRLGVGVRRRFSRRWAGVVEVAGDIHRSGQGGAAGEVIYEPDDRWRLTVGATSFAEDLPLRARAAGIDGRRADSGLEFNSHDYVWYGRVSVNRYEFSDTNERSSLYAALGYAFELLPYREQRLYVEWYQSRNTLDGAPYFNPQRDRSVGLIHRTDFVFESRFQRHVDSLYLNVSLYDQDDFGAHSKWAVTYEQDYHFDDFNHFGWGLTYARNVYDGAAEYETRAQLRYVRRF